jgi:hypothetical protein
MISLHLQSATDDQRARLVYTASKGLPTGPVERTLEYLAPFTLQNRETDYATVWVKLDPLEQH